MIKSHLKSISSIGICLALIASSFFTSINTSVLAEPTNEIINSDDFESYSSDAQLLDKWETISIDSSISQFLIRNDASVSKQNGTANSTAFCGADCYNESNILINDTLRKKIATFIKSENWSPNLLKEVSFDLKLEPNSSYTSNSPVVLYYDGTNSIIMEYSVSDVGVISTQLSYNGLLSKSETATKESVKFNCYDSKASDYDPWVTFTVNYSYEFENNAVKTLGVNINAANTNKTYKSIRKSGFSNATDSFRVGVIAQVNKVFSGTLFDNFKFDFEKSYSDLANDFKAANAQILAMQENSIIRTDAADLINTFKNYENCYPKTKNYLDAELGKLKALKKTMIKKCSTDTSTFSGDNFNDSEISSLIWETDLFAATEKIEDFKITQNSDSGTLKAAKYNARYKAITTPCDEAWPQQSIQSAEFRMKILNNAGLDSNSAIYSIYLPAYGTNADPIGIGVQFEISGGNLVARYVNFYGNNYFTPPQAVSNLLYPTQGISAADWITFKINYNMEYWEKNNSVVLSYTFTDAKGNSFTTSDYTYVIKKGNTNLPDNYFKVGIGNYTGQSDIVYDYVKTTFKSTERDLANNYISNYRDVFNITPQAYTSADKARVLEAITDLVKLKDSTKLILFEDGIIKKLKLLSSEFDMDSDSQQFATEYAKLLAVLPGKITPESTDELQAALDAYNAFAPLKQLRLLSQYEILVRQSIALESYIPQRAEGDYSPLTADFENGINPFHNIVSDPYEKLQIVKDPLDETNSVCAFKGRFAYFVPFEAYWPKGAQVTAVKFRIYAPSQNDFNPLRIFTSYTDEENYSSICIRPNIVTYRLMESGVAIEQEAGFSKINLNGGWIDITMNYSDNGKIMMILKDCTNEVKSFVANTQVNGGKFGFGFVSSYGRVGAEAYIDDIKIDFKKGDFDINDPIGKININYSGNVFMKAGDTVTLAGCNLGKTVDKIYMMRIGDISSDTVGYIKETSYNTTGDYGRDSQTLTNPVWDNSMAIEIKALQTSYSTINFVIPDNFKDGVFAVKITPKNNEYDDEYLYINNPSISFIMGDEGSTATRNGWVRIIGQNLVPTGVASDVTVKFKKTGASEFLTLPVTKIYEKDMYSLEVAIPKDMAYGEYSVFVNNGYGDNTCWSAPLTININASPRDSWPDKIFNVRDYGAKGDNFTNDTGAILNALQAAADNGGGVVYLPKGYYRVVSTIPIPENVVFKGDNATDTILLWTARRWQYGEVPGALLTMQGGNVEICNIGLYATRCAMLITVDNKTGISDNVYIHDIYTHLSWGVGYITAGGTGGPSTGEYTEAEVRMTLIAETSSKTFIKFCDYDRDNIQLYNVELNHQKGGTYFQNFTLYGSNIRVSNVTCDEIYSGCFSKKNLIVEDCELAGFEPTSNGVYYARNYSHDVWTNNRELMTTDGGCRTDMVVQKVAENESVTINDKKMISGLEYKENCTYRVIGYNFYKNSFAGFDLAVASGQGVGQCRTILENNEGILILDEPFNFDPNRNSMNYITRPRTRWFFVNNQFVEGSASGTYGAMMDAVFDNNTYSYHQGQYFCSHNSPMWYISDINSIYNKAAYVHGEIIGGESSDLLPKQQVDSLLFQTLRLHESKYQFTTIGFLIRSNDYDGYGINVQGSPMSNAADGIVIEKNSFKNKEYAIGFTSTAKNTFTNYLIRNNHYDTENEYDEHLLSCYNSTDNINVFGSKRLMIFSTGDVYGSKIGDVNRDGVITLKDSTLVKYHFLGKLQLNDNQLSLADINGDGVVDLKDSTLIRKYVTTGVYPSTWVGTGEDTSDGNDVVGNTGENWGYD